jgi:pimeloyl-ACP methyl ester carboxylesterase
VDTERRSLTLRDGRVIEFLVAGPADGLPLVLHEGTPCGLVLFPPTVRTAAIRGLRVILAARPGYEGSTPRPGRRVVDVAEDTAAILDELGADTFVTIGWSGGGPHALACAAALPGRCLAAASVAGVAPYPAGGLDWLAGMGPENVAEFGAAMSGEAALTAFLDTEAAMIGAVTGETVAKSLGGLVIEADRAVLTGEFADYIAAALRASTNAGIAGWRDDDLAFTSDWGFSLGWDSPSPAPAQPAPVAVWQGDQDQMVPFAHGQWLAANIRGARVHLMPGDGHLSMTVSAFDRILDDLLDLAGLAGLLTPGGSAACRLAGLFGVPHPEQAVGDRPGDQRHPVGGDPVGERGQHGLAGVHVG